MNAFDLLGLNRKVTHVILQLKRIERPFAHLFSESYTYLEKSSIWLLSTTPVLADMNLAPNSRLTFDELSLTNKPIM